MKTHYYMMPRLSFIYESYVHRGRIIDPLSVLVLMCALEGGIMPHTRLCDESRKKSRRDNCRMDSSTINAGGESQPTYPTRISLYYARLRYVQHDDTRLVHRNSTVRMYSRHWILVLSTYVTAQHLAAKQ